LILYFDTSAFVKLVVSEPGTAQAVALWEGADRVFSSLLLYPQSRAALGRAGRSRRLDGRQLVAARKSLDRLWRDVDRIGLTEALALEAGELAERHALRAYDAVHLASLERVHDEETFLVSTDEALLEAASSLGFAALQPAG
jgi:hypothetical protein